MTLGGYSRSTSNVRGGYCHCAAKYRDTRKREVEYREGVEGIVLRMG
jgi:hypothetical protein